MKHSSSNSYKRKPIRTNVVALIVSRIVGVVVVLIVACRGVVPG